MTNKPKKKSTRGGRRPGSGRKPLTDGAAAQNLRITVTVEDMAYIDAHADGNRSQFVRDLIEMHRAREKALADTFGRESAPGSPPAVSMLNRTEE